MGKNDDTDTTDDGTQIQRDQPQPVSDDDKENGDDGADEERDEERTTESDDE